MSYKDPEYWRDSYAKLKASTKKHGILIGGDSEEAKDQQSLRVNILMNMSGLDKIPPELTKTITKGLYGFNPKQILSGESKKNKKNKGGLIDYRKTGMFK
tara:strand:+ start:166 stop:465 length:300 start_codon:yes stop_codon:yes gene_type:complete